MKNLVLIIIAAIVFTACNPSKKSKTETPLTAPHTYECELFSVSYPEGYNTQVDSISNFKRLSIAKDSLNQDKTIVMWESPNDFPGTVNQFVTVFASSEIKDFKEAGTFYDIIDVDSTYTIDGNPTYNITSIFTEDADTIIQSRTGLIIPGKLDMMIIQRASTKNSESDVKKYTDIINSIKFKK